MRTTTRLLAFGAALAALSACAGSTTPSQLVDNFGSFNGARVAIVAEGGFAALRVVDSVDHDMRVYMHLQSPLCAPGCSAPRDSAAGTFPATTTDSIFSAVLAQKNVLKDDYGTTRGGADMMTYTIRITSDGSTKTIRADDGTMPGALRQLVSGIRAAIAAVRR